MVTIRHSSNSSSHMSMHTLGLQKCITPRVLGRVYRRSECLKIWVIESNSESLHRGRKKSVRSQSCKTFRRRSWMTCEKVDVKVYFWCWSFGCTFVFRDTRKFHIHFLLILCRCNSLVWPYEFRVLVPDHLLLSKRNTRSKKKVKFRRYQCQDRCQDVRMQFDRKP